MIKLVMNSILRKASLWTFENDQETLNEKILIFHEKLEENNYDEEILQGREADCLWDFAEALWMCKDFEMIDTCKVIVASEELEKEEYDATIFPCFDRLSEIAEEYEKGNSSIRSYLWASGFAEIYAYEEAVHICENLLKELPADSALIIDIRQRLIEWYWDIDANKDKELENLKQLLKIVSNPKEYKRELERLLLYCRDDIAFFVELLKKSEDVELWEIIYECGYWYDSKIIDIYESVSPVIVLSKKVYMDLFDAYLLEEEYQKAKNILEIVNRNYNDEYLVGIMKIRLFILGNEWQDALENVEIMKEIYPEKEELLVYKGKILYHKQEYNGALGCFDNCIEEKNKVRTIEYCISSKLLLGREQEAIDNFLECYRQYESAASDYLTHWIATNQMGETFLVKVLESLQVTKYEQPYYASDINLQDYILRVTEKLSKGERGKIRYHLIRLYLCINNIKSNLAIETDEVYHYSREYSLKYLPKYSEGIGGSKLRLSNVAYLNDPAEGKTFFEMLEKECMIENTDELLRIQDDFKYENTFLVSFSAREDFLPLWVQYADDGKGCCYAIDSRKFKRYEKKTERHIIEGELLFSLKSKRLNENSLYKVFYYGTENDDKEIITLCKLVGYHLKTLESAMDNRKINRIIIELLDSIRYLFKDQAYKAEEEVRIVQVDYYGEKKIDTTTGNIPRFYMELQEPLHFNRIMLGPKAVNIKEKVTYLCNCSNVEKVVKSKIKYV